MEKEFKSNTLESKTLEFKSNTCGFFTLTA